MANRFRNVMNEVVDARPPLSPSAEQMALIVVDMQYFDAHRDWGEGRTAKELGVAEHFEEYFDQIDTIVPQIQKLLKLFRNKAMEVIHIRVAELTEDSRDVGRKQLVRGFVVPAGSREADFLEELAPIDDELIISKSSSGVFPVTNLDRLLRNMHINTLVFTGTSTNGCVESAVRDAVDIGYNVVVVSDACAAGTRETHELALVSMEGALTRILSTDDVESLVQPLEPVSREARSGLKRVEPYLPQPGRAGEEDDQNPYDGILPPALELPLTRDNAALLLVDGQRMTCDPSCGLGTMARDKGEGAVLDSYFGRVERAIDGMARLLESARARGLPVIHVRTAGRFPDGRDLSRKKKVQGFRFGPDSEEAQFMPALRPQNGELVLNKPASGVFTGTGLDDILRNLGVENLVLGGVSYDGAIQGSVRSISDRGYGLILVPDACATYIESRQKRLWDVESGVIQVKDVAETVIQLNAL